MVHILFLDAFENNSWESSDIKPLAKEVDKLSVNIKQQKILSGSLLWLHDLDSFLLATISSSNYVGHIVSYIIKYAAWNWREFLLETRQ